MIREYPPLEIEASIDVVIGNAQKSRWASDASDPGDVMQGLTFSDTMPGGDESMSAALIRIAERDYPDLAKLVKITLRGVGGEVAWQGRLDQAPRTSGDQIEINPQAVGFQATLDDDSSVRLIPIDQDFSQWLGAGIRRKLNMVSGLNPDGSALVYGQTDVDDPSNVVDPTQQTPALETGFSGPWARSHDNEAWYDAAGVPIDRVLWRWALNGIFTNLSSIDPNWVFSGFLSDDNVGTASDLGTNQNNPAYIYPGWPGYGDGVINATTSTRKWAAVYLLYNGAGGGGGGTDGTQAGLNYAIDWLKLAVVGKHSGIGIHGVWPDVGVLAHEVVAYALDTWSDLAFDINPVPGFDPDYSIQQSGFQIPHLTFKDPLTTLNSVITQSIRFELPDWYIRSRYGQPTFFLNDRGARARTWVARTGPSHLVNAGAQSTSLWNGVVVSFTDTTGVARTVGPPGSGANVEDPSLLDADPENPVNAAGGKPRYAPVTMGTSTAPGAIRVGAMFLQEHKLINLSGAAQFDGYAEDDRGNIWPAWMVRSGDYVKYVDASDTSPRRIVRREWDDAQKRAAVTLDSPPDSMQQVLERLSIAIMPYGLS